jgi:hypothetical protein
LIKSSGILQAEREGSQALIDARRVMSSDEISAGAWKK